MVQVRSCVSSLVVLLGALAARADEPGPEPLAAPWTQARVGDAVQYRCEYTGDPRRDAVRVRFEVVARDASRVCVRFGVRKLDGARLDHPLVRDDAIVEVRIDPSASARRPVVPLPVEMDGALYLADGLTDDRSTSVLRGVRTERALTLEENVRGAAADGPITPAEGVRPFARPGAFVVWVDEGDAGIEEALVVCYSVVNGWVVEDWHAFAPGGDASAGRLEVEGRALHPAPDSPWAGQVFGRLAPTLLKVVDEATAPPAPDARTDEGPIVQGPQGPIPTRRVLIPRPGGSERLVPVDPSGPGLAGFPLVALRGLAVRSTFDDSSASRRLVDWGPR